MREKLIQILNEPGNVGDYDFHEREIRKALESLRCENCKNFQVIGPQKVTYCFLLDNLYPEPDFFCAHFEERS